MSLNAKTAYIDLTTGAVKTEPVSDDRRRRFLGGRGLNIEQIYSRQEKGADPLSPRNTVAVSPGLFAGMLAAGACRTCISAKSPLTGYLGVANIGGFFASELRRAGFDQLVITGKAKKPALILAHDGKIVIHDASFLWGQTIPDTQEILRKELEEEDIQTVCIGPAGENQVRMASVGTRFESDGSRSGIGAVFGSKNLKAIVARGNKGVPIARPKEALEYDLELERRITSTGFAANMRDYGPFSIGGSTEDPFALQTIGPDGCYGCLLQCGRRFAIRRGPYAGTYGHVPGFLTAQAWMEVIGKDDPDAVLYSSHLCNSLGLDSLEAAGIIAWLMELQSRRILTVEDTDGIDLRPGNAEAVNAMIRTIASHKGLGSLLAEGAARAADKIGKGSALHLRESKDVTTLFGGRNPTPWQALGVATACVSEQTRYIPPADPTRLDGEAFERVLAGPVRSGKALSADPRDYASAPWLAFWTEMHGVGLDMLGICDFESILFDPDFPGFAEWSKTLSLNAGIDMPPEDIWKAAERACNMERLFNIREGYKPNSERLANWHPREGYSGADEGEPLDETRFDAMLADYYALRGWDSKGAPSPETLRRLGLDSFGR